MSIPNLPVDFKDDILSSTNKKRKYTEINNLDGTKSFEDSTEYDQVGSDFGASQVNKTNQAVNNIYSERILDIDELELVTEPGFFVDALAVKELNSKTEDSGWVQMTGSGNFSQMLDCRKIGKTVYVMGTLHFADSGAFTNDQWVATVPAEMKPSASYGTYECLIPIAHHNGSGTQARIYIRPDNRRVYITGTGSATNAIAAVACYLTDD